MFYETQKAIGIDTDNMISFDTYRKGRNIHCFSFFLNETVQDTLPVERSANLRISLSFAVPSTYPRVVLLLADTKGILSIDNERVVTCDVRG